MPRTPLPGLPDFLVVGAPKAGTTAVHEALLHHPQLFLTTPKESKFFLTDGPPPRSQHRGPGDAHSRREWIWRPEEYARLFDAAPPGVLKGESTPFYLWDKAAHVRIARTVPDVLLVAVLRDPIDRAHANWDHLRSGGLEPEPDFLRACALETDRVTRGYAPFWRYLDLGRYGEQLAHLFHYVDRERVHVVRYEDLVAEPLRTLEGITTFLGVEPGQVADVPPSNSHPWARPSLVNSLLRRAIRTGAAVGAFAPPQVWRWANRPLLRALRRGSAQRPSLSAAARRTLLPAFSDDIALLSDVLRTPPGTFDHWLSDDDDGPYHAPSLTTDDGPDDSRSAPPAA